MARLLHPQIEKLKDKMDERRITVVELARESGLDRSRLSNVLNGITAEELRNLNAAYARLTRPTHAK